MTWHSKDSDRVLLEVQSSPHGLSKDAAEAAGKQYGPNELTGTHARSAINILLSQFKDVMIIMLLAAAIVSGILGDTVDTIIIAAIVVLNATLGFIQEYRAEKTMEALRSMATPIATVERDGAVAQIPAVQIVPGDIIHLETGQVVPADLRLLEVYSLRIEEAALTGESVPTDKTAATIDREDIPVADRLNMAYKATLVTGGRGKGVAVATGMQTEIGKIAGMLGQKGGATPLQVRMADFSKKLTWIIGGLCLVVLGMGLVRGEPLPEMLLISITLGVAAIPEALPTLITIALARGAKRLAAKNVVVRRLPAVETLGSVTFICTDKTGTLTRNQMEVVKVQPAEKGEKVESVLELCMALNNDVRINGENKKLIGDPTETALVDYLLSSREIATFSSAAKEYPRVAEVPFDADRKLMTTVHRHPDGYLVVTKGAAEAVEDRLRQADNEKFISDEAHTMAAEGMRVLAFAYKIVDELPTEVNYDIEQQLTFAGLVGMIDPPRDEVKQAVKEAMGAGIIPVMITGDHPATAAAIARQIGMLPEDAAVISGSELSKMTDDELAKKVEQIRVYARVSPEQKLRIVKALQQRGHFIAMTGDGANDAPSLKAANIGIAMGITGTDVSKEAAHLVLMDDNFATIVKAVKEGRRIYDNIRHFIKYIMTCNSAEILIILFAPLFGMPVPLMPIHILWINLVTDGLPGIALASEKPEAGLMHRKPRPANESMFAHGTGRHIIWVSILMTIITLGTQHFSMATAGTHWQTMTFTVLLMSQLGHVFAIRSDTQIIIKKGIFSNPFLLVSIAITALLQIGIIYLPFANKLFHTSPLTPGELGITIALSLVVFLAAEAEKLISAAYRKK